jgi:hypothetical protein
LWQERAVRAEQEADMGSLPLHPAIVHLPMALAVLMPIVAAGFTWALWTGRVGPRARLAVVALQALLLASGFAAIQTGELEEERVEAVVQERAIHEHEQRAEAFVWASGLTLGVAMLAMAWGRPAATRATAVLVVLMTVIVAGLGVRVGRAGGELVYVHGAASAYTASPSAAAREIKSNERGLRSGDRDR